MNGQYGLKKVLSKMNQTRWTGPAIGENNVFSDKWAAVQARSQITNIMHSLNGAERSLFLTAISSFSEHGPNTLKCNPSWFSSNNNTGYATSASVSFRQFIGVFQDVHPNHREQYYEQWINEASKLDISDMIHEYFQKAHVVANDFGFPNIGSAVAHTGLVEPPSGVEPLWDTVRNSLGSRISEEFLSMKQHKKMSGLTQFLAFLDFLNEKHSEKMPFTIALKIIDDTLKQIGLSIQSIESLDDPYGVLKTYTLKNQIGGDGFIYLCTANPPVATNRLTGMLSSLGIGSKLEMSCTNNLSTNDVVPNSHALVRMRGDFDLKELEAQGASLRYLNGLAHETGHALQNTLLATVDQRHWSITAPQAMSEYLTAMDALETPSMAFQYMVTSKKLSAEVQSYVPSRFRSLTASHALGIWSSEVDRILTRQSWDSPITPVDQIASKAFRACFKGIYCPDKLPLTHLGLYNRFNWYTGAFMAYPLAFVRSSAAIKSISSSKGTGQLDNAAMDSIFGRFNFRSDCLRGGFDFPQELHMKPLCQILEDVPMNSPLSRWRLEHKIASPVSKPQDFAPSLVVSEGLVTPALSKNSQIDASNSLPTSNLKKINNNAANGRRPTLVTGAKAPAGPVINSWSTNKSNK